MTDYNINNAKNDIENLQEQNSYDYQEIKRLDGLIKDYDKRVLQAINMNNLINKKIQDDYEEFKKTIIDDNFGSGGGSGEGLTSTQKQQLQISYEHSQSNHVTMDEVNVAISNAQLGGGEVNLSNYYTKTEVDRQITNAQLGGGEVDLSNYYTKTEVDRQITNASLNGSMGIEDLFISI